MEDEEATRMRLKARAYMEAKKKYVGVLPGGDACVFAHQQMALQKTEHRQRLLQESRTRRLEAAMSSSSSGRPDAAELMSAELAREAQQAYAARLREARNDVCWSDRRSVMKRVRKAPDRPIPLRPHPLPHGRMATLYVSLFQSFAATERSCWVQSSKLVRHYCMPPTSCETTTKSFLLRCAAIGEH